MMKKFTPVILICLLLPWSNTAIEMCGEIPINPTKDKCCDDNLFMGVAQAGLECCGNTVYDPLGMDACCDTVLHFNQAAADMECCGTNLCPVVPTIDPIDDPQFFCYPNGTLEFINPDTALYTEFFAVEDEGLAIALICTVNTEGERILVSGCNTDNRINLFLSNRSISDNTTFGGIDTRNYLLECAQIASAGVDRTVTEWLDATLEVTTQDAITPSFTVASSIRSADYKGPIVSAAKVGETLYWTIDIPSDYYGRPTCTAYSGTDNSGTPNAFLVSDGCSQDTSLVDGDFTNVDSAVPGAPLIKRLWTTLYVFQFFNSEDIYMECTVKVCPTTDGCNIACARRRKRSVEDEEEDEMFITRDRLHIIPGYASRGNTNLGTSWLITAIVSTFVCYTEK